MTKTFSVKITLINKRNYFNKNYIGQNIFTKKIGRVESKMICNFTLN